MKLKSIKERIKWWAKDNCSDVEYVKEALMQDILLLDILEEVGLLSGVDRT